MWSKLTLPLFYYVYIVGRANFLSFICTSTKLTCSILRLYFARNATWYHIPYTLCEFLLCIMSYLMLKYSPKCESFSPCPRLGNKSSHICIHLKQKYYVNFYFLYTQSPIRSSFQPIIASRLIYLTLQLLFNVALLLNSLLISSMMFTSKYRR